MKFRTEVNLPVSGVSLEIEDHVFSMGSCFATELSDLLQTGQIQTLNNPFGTVFNPFSINHAIKKLHDAELYTEEDLVQFNDEVISL
ncbi:MAG: GSCFA domain-containing protein, partial [Kaistella sp.]